MASSITELLDVIKKTGLPLGDKLAKKEQELAAQDVIASQLYGQYQPQFATLDADKKKKIEALANVDKQFSALFGKGGKYALRNPMDVENLSNQGFNLQLGDFNRIAQEGADLRGEFDKDVSKATELYGSLKPSAGGSDDSWADVAKYIPGLSIDANGNLIIGKDSEWEVVPEAEWEIVNGGSGQQGKLKGIDIINNALG